MPNHIHGIIIIDYDTTQNTVGDEHLRLFDKIYPFDKMNKTRNEDIRSLRRTNLSSIIKGFKIGAEQMTITISNGRNLFMIE